MKILRIAAALALPAGLAAAQQQPPKEIVAEAVALGRPADFAQDVLPVLKSKCLACHNAKDKQADLVLEAPAQMIAGGESGPAVVPGKPDESLLVKTASHRIKPYMPPLRNKIGAVPLTPRELGILKVWIAEGAKGSAAAAQILPPAKLKAPPPNWNPIYAVAVDPDAQVVACGRAGRLFLYHVPTQKLLDRPGDPALQPLAPGLAHADAVQSIAFSPDGRLLATGGYRTIKIWTRTLPEKSSKIDAGGEPVLVALSPDGTKAAAAFADFAVRTFDVPSGKRLEEIKDHKAALVSLRFSADGATLLSASEKTVRLHGTNPAAIEAPDAISAAEWVGGKVATGHPDGTIRIWSDGQAKELKGHKGVVTDLRAAGAALVSASQDGKVKIWNVEKGDAAKDLAAAGVTALAVSPDGKRIVTAGGDGAKLWDLESAKAVADLKTDGPARRQEQEAGALLAFAGSELSYRQGQVKAAEDAKKKEEEEVKKAADAVGPAEAAHKEKAEAAAKATAAREAADKTLAEAKAAVDAAKAKVEAVAKSLDDALTDAGLKKLEAEHAGGSRERDAAAKAVEDAQKRADGKAKALADAKAADAARSGGDKAVADKALADAQKVYDEAKARLAAAMKSLGEAKDDEAKKKAEKEKAAADEQVVALRAKRNDARTKAEAAAKTGASLPPSDAAKKAEAEKAEADKALADSKKALEKAQPGGGIGAKLLAAARAAAALRKAEKAPAVDPLKAAADAAGKAAAEAKAKADAAAKALGAAKDDAKKKAEGDKKAADEALAKAEKAKADADAALAAAKAKADAAAAAQAALDAAKKDVETEKAAAEKAVAAGEAPLKDAEKKQDEAKKADDAAVQAAEQAKLALESAKRRAEKAKEVVETCQKNIEAAQAALKAQQDERARLEQEKKKADETLKKGATAVKSLAVTSDGALAALGTSDGRIFLFDVQRGAEAGVVEAHKAVALALAGPGASIVSLAADGTSRTAAATPSWTLTRTIEAKEPGASPVDRVTTLEFSPDGKRLASGGGIASREGELLIWKVADGTLERAIAEAHSDTVYDVAFSPDGAQLASGAADKFAKIFEVATGKHVKSFEGHTYHVLGVSWSATGRTLATAGGDGAVKVWSVTTGQQTKSIAGFDKQVTAIRHLGYDAKFAVVSGGTPPRVVKEDGGNERTFDAGGSTFFYALSTSPDGRLVAAGGLDGVLRLWRSEANGLAASFAP